MGDMRTRTSSAAQLISRHDRMPYCLAPGSAARATDSEGVVVLIGMWAILALTVGSFGLAVLEHGCGSESQGSTTAP